MIKYSVIIPLYNKGWRIKRAIDSVLRQGIEDLEIVVVDDGSTDGSAGFVKSYKDARIHYIYKENGGVSSARNKGIKEATGEWLLFLDADDEMLKGAISIYEKMAKRYPKSKFFVGKNIWRDSYHVSNRIHYTFQPFFSIWLNRLYPSPRNMMIHKSLIDGNGLFDERQSFYEDYGFILKMCRSGEVSFTDEPTGIYHQEGGGLSGTPHPLDKEMAYYIPEILAKGDTTFWERALLYENIEHEIAWWQGHPKELAFYRDMQRKHFAWYHKYLHWLRLQLKRHGVI